MSEQIDSNNPVITQLLRGERPKEMSYEEFKVKRKMIENYLRRKKKGNFIYISEEPVTITDEDGNKKKIIKNYGPYRKNK